MLVLPTMLKSPPQFLWRWTISHKRPYKIWLG